MMTKLFFLAFLMGQNALATPIPGEDLALSTNAVVVPPETRIGNVIHEELQVNKRDPHFYPRPDAAAVGALRAGAAAANSAAKAGSAALRHGY